MDNKEGSRNLPRSHCATQYDPDAEQLSIFVGNQNDLSYGSRYYATPPSNPPSALYGKLLIMFYPMHTKVANKKAQEA